MGRIPLSSDARFEHEQNIQVAKQTAASRKVFVLLIAFNHYILLMI